MIEPTVGRVVWFYRHVQDKGFEGPMAAHIAFVNTPSVVNLMAIDLEGRPRPEKMVQLVQDDDMIPNDDYCTWMPYQKGQAAKTEALEKQLGK